MRSYEIGLLISSNYTCRAKAPNHGMGLGPHLGRLAMSEERKWMLKGFPTQVSWIGVRLKDGPRRNASSDVMSMAQTCTLSARRTHPNRHQQQRCIPQTRRKEGNVRYPRRGCCYRIKCVAATFLAALMWRGPVNSAVLATTTHRRLKGGVRWDKHSIKGLDDQKM